MDPAHLPNRSEELRDEQQVLLKAQVDIEEGWNRVRDQQDLLTCLRNEGKQTREAERLLHLFRRTLVEWERHRILIEQRVAYLEKGSSGA